MRRWFLATSAIAIALMLGGSARADLTITIGNVSIPEGGTGFLDVMIKSTDGSAQNLAQAGYEFLITPDINVITMMPTATTLEFTLSQPQGYMSEMGYVFPMSGNVQFMTTNGAVSTVNNPNDRLSGGDNNLDPGLTNVSVTGDVLLIRLQLTANLFMLPGIPPVVGDTFKVRLLTPSDDPFGTSTLFQDQVGNDLTYTSTIGTVTITARAVPEPGSLAMLALGAIAIGTFARRRLHVN